MAEELFGAGQVVGPYQLVRELGRGGMGRVYLARDTSVGDRLVALKVIASANGGTHGELNERFLREIRNLARLRHGNIVTIFNAGEHRGHAYFAMDYVSGRDLSRYAAECSSLPERDRIARIVKLMATVARAIHYAHSKGIVHRDLKPANIIIAHDHDEPVLLDFGIAKSLDDPGLTRVETPGTPAYLAPEQLDLALKVRDESIDVWQLGVVLYRVLTAKHPFSGDDSAALADQILRGTPSSARSLNPAIPRGVDDLIARCLQKDPRLRPPTAAAVAEELEHGSIAGTSEPMEGRATTATEIVRVPEPRSETPGVTSAGRVAGPRLEWIDICLLGFFLPLLLAWISLSLYQGVPKTWPPLYISMPSGSEEYPRVDYSTTWNPSEQPQLRRGDTLLSIGSVDLEGIGPFRFPALVLREAQSGSPLQMVVRTGNDRRSVQLDPREQLLPSRTLAIGWFELILTLVVSTLMLLYARDRRPARELFVALSLAVFCFGVCAPGPPWQTYSILALALIGQVFVAPFLLRGVSLISLPAAGKGRTLGPHWPWLLCPVIALSFFGRTFGYPISGERALWMNSAWVIAFGVGVPGILSVRYRHADAIGRRQIKWLVFGAYVTFVPTVLVMALWPILVPYQWIFDWVRLAWSAILISLLIAMTWYNLFDIDRLLSATLAYSAASIVVGGGAIALVLGIAATVIPMVPVDRELTQLGLSLVLAAVVVPLQRSVRPHIDRVFFPERYALECGFQDVLRELASTRSWTDGLLLAGSRLTELIRPESCVVYAANGRLFEPIFARGTAAAALEADDPVIAALRRRSAPLIRDRWLGPRRRDLTSFDRAVLEMLGAFLVLPIHRRGTLHGFISLGGKRSGDVYTTSDAALLTAVADKLSTL